MSRPRMVADGKVTIPACNPTPTSAESHPAAWAEYEAGRAERKVIVTGQPGRCSGCGRFLAKTTWVNKGFPPTIMWGRVDFDPGFIEHIYRCTNDDCQPDHDY